MQVQALHILVRHAHKKNKHQRFRKSSQVVICMLATETVPHQPLFMYKEQSSSIQVQWALRDLRSIRTSQVTIHATQHPAPAGWFAHTPGISSRDVAWWTKTLSVFRNWISHLSHHGLECKCIKYNICTSNIMQIEFEKLKSLLDNWNGK
jgi:hypothetical protein